MSDLCASPFCADIALPGQDLCPGCLADLQAERARIDQAARDLTDVHEQRILEAEEAAV